MGTSIFCSSAEAVCAKVPVAPASQDPFPAALQDKKTATARGRGPRILATSSRCKPLFWGVSTVEEKWLVKRGQQALSEQRASIPPNPAFSTACSHGQGQKQENWILSPAPQSHTQPQHHGNEFIDADGR